MSDEERRARRGTLFVGILLFLGSLVIIYPFLDAVIFAITVSYLLSFAHRWVHERINNELASSVIIISTVLGFFALSLYFFINNAFFIQNQFQIFAISLEGRVVGALEALSVPETFTNNVSVYFSNFSNMASQFVIDLFFALPKVMIHLGIFLVTAIYLYRDRTKLKAEIENLLDSIPETEEKIIRSLLQSMDSIFRGVFVTQFIVAISMAIATAIGFYLISLVTSPMPLIPLWSFLIALAALLPLIAGIMIYGPVGVYYLAVTQEPLKGTFILLYGIVFLQILPEIFLRPYVGSKSLDEHPLIIFIGFLAGPLVLGLKGLILGPLTLILTKEYLFDYTNLVSSETPETRIEDKEE